MTCYMTFSYRHCWQVVKEDVVCALHAIWLGRDQDFECLNNVLITLLPKKVDAVNLSDFTAWSTASHAYSPRSWRTG
jgi:hypothetical protein